MIGDSKPEYFLIRGSVLALRAITPISAAYAAAGFHPSLAGPLQRIPLRVLWYWAIAECAFFIFVYIPRCIAAQKAPNYPPLPPRHERIALFRRCLNAVENLEGYITGWFFGAPLSSIKRENLREWLAWGVLAVDQATVTHDEEFIAELDEYVLEVEQQLQHHFEDGREDSLHCMRQSLDPVHIVHRPLLWYLLVGIVDHFTHIFLLFLGFRHHSTRNIFSVFPPRPLTLFSSPLPARNVSYWYRPHRSTAKVPILFTHGIGIGLLPYLGFLHQLATYDKDIGIIAMENLSISMRILSSSKILTAATFGTVIENVMNHHEISKFVLVGHSFGTFLAGQLLQNSSTEPRVTSVVLIDPIPFLLFEPDVVYNFLYRKPGPWRAAELMIEYFTSRDLGISTVLSRHLFWSQGALWKEDEVFTKRNVLVVLSGRDQIVPAGKVWRYLTGDVNGEASKLLNDELEDRVWEHDNLTVVKYETLDHGQILSSRARNAPIVRRILAFSSSTTV